MITNKDIRVENGSLILNGDPYPLDGQSPEAIMQIVKDNSDSTPTENSTKPVKSGGIYSKIGDLTQTGITGASVAAQLTEVAGQIGDLNFAVLSQTFTAIDITTAWGSLYISDILSFDISSLGLTTAPKTVSLAINSRSATAILIIDSVNTGNIKFYLLRANTTSDAEFTISANIVY